MLKLGNQGMAAMYLGGRKITKAYLGEALVFGASAPPEPVRYTVTLSVDPQGGGTASGGGSVEAGAQVTVTASASSGYTFSGWRENGSIVSTSASYTFTVTGDRSLTAVFAAVIPTYRVTAGIDPEGSGTASGAGTYQQGTSVTVTAAPGEGYRFVKWTENGQTVSESQSYTFTVTGDRTLTAVFEESKYVSGADWWAASLPSSQIWSSITYGAGKFVAVAYSSNKAAYSSGKGPGV